MFWRYLALMLLILVGLMSPVAAAMTAEIPFARLGVEKTAMLPSIRSQRDLIFTRSRIWQVLPGSHLKLVFHHSSRLLPDRSYLEVLLNGRVLNHTTLTSSNSTATVLNVPLPPALLKDKNTLSIRVEQHYRNECEDPLHQVLWTQLLPESSLVWEFNELPPKVDLSYFPFPLIDPLDPRTANLDYVLPEKRRAMDVQAMTILHTYLAEWAGKDRRIQGQIESNIDSSKSLLLIGSAGRLSNRLSLLNRVYSVANTVQLVNNQWVEPITRTPLSPGEGLIIFTPDPANTKKLLLVASGNDDAGVLQAVRRLVSMQYAENKTKVTGMKGQVFRVSASEPFDEMKGQKTALENSRILDGQARSLSELGFPTQVVRKLNAPPITYEIPVATSFAKADTQLHWELHYGYASGLNPGLSAMEVRLNDRSIASVPLDNPYGEEDKTLSLQIPSELIKPFSRFVVQFHMAPDKDDRCHNTFVDNSWGRIDGKRSRFTYQGPAPNRLPDIQFLKAAGYPYNQYRNFSSWHLLLPENPSSQLLNTILAISGRFGRYNDFKEPPDMSVSFASDNNQQENQQENQHWMSFLTAKNAGEKEASLFYFNPKAHAQIPSRQLWLPDAVQVWDDANTSGVYVEQSRLSGQSHRLWTRWWVTDEALWPKVQHFFESDEQFKHLEQAVIGQLRDDGQFQPADSSLVSLHGLSDKPGERQWYQGLLDGFTGIPWVGAAFSGLFAWCASLPGWLWWVGGLVTLGVFVLMAFVMFLGARDEMDLNVSGPDNNEIQ
ncbi:MAG: cellulose biosynthesis cyclic di-GMP-binding regulatory protein BcsB [Cyanobacteria bacterium]|nr:cellulose biosynthesis cyclic di-GMP-binding regulatory protein BcsB [Cyanobacteriota bacterium]